ncbi:MAG: acylphosphatase [Firmicutes bacterium]|nr:acylphosphatase [Bacillota bacterium]
MERLHILVTGRVQGVGFRNAAQSQAAALGLVGWVRNAERFDQVEMEVEGPPEKLEAFLEWLKVGPALAKVMDVHAFAIEPIEEQTFRILR